MNTPIPMTAEPLPFTPRSLILAAGEDADKASLPSFTVKPVTAAEADRLGYELFRHNLVPPSNDTFRATMIDECYELFGDEDGETKAQMLDAYWQAEDVHGVQMSDWHEQERQRMADEHKGAQPEPPRALPPRLLGLRDRNKALKLAEDLRHASRKVRDLTVEMNSYETVQRSGICRLVTTGWRNLKTPFAIVDGIVPQETYDALREEIGKPALIELENFCAGLGGVSKEDVGNSGSLPVTAPMDEPSSEQTGAPSSDGSSTSGDVGTPTDHSKSNSDTVQ